MKELSELLWPEERAALRPPERFTVSEWADRHRVLDPMHCARPGPWRTDFAPYLRGILNAYGNATVREIVLMQSTQVAKTESLLNMLLYTIDQDPAPTLFVLPTEDDVVSFGARRLKSAIEYAPRVRAHRTRWAADWKSHELGFDQMVLYLGWSNSPAKLASRSIGRLFMDEVDKYPAFSGKEADPISLASHRLRWYPDSTAVYASTPTTADGYIWQRWLNSNQQWYHVPCPFCGFFQRLTFSRETVVWPDDERDPEKIQAGRLASYVCEDCEKPIPDDDDHKSRMLLDGVWCPEGGKVNRRGKVTGTDAVASAVQGFHVNALYSPVLSWSEVAAEFLRTKDSEATLLDFTNGWLGWPWMEKATELTTDAVAARAIDIQQGFVPAEAVVLTAGVDVQQHELYFALRAHGVGQRSVTILAGTVETFAELAVVLFHTAYPFIGDESRSLPVRLACIDSGYRTDEVYLFCADFPDVARPIKGHQRRVVPVSPTRIERDWIGKAGGLQLWNLDVGYFKDKLARHMSADLGTPGCWNVHANPEEAYLLQMTSEHKGFVRSRTTKRVTQEWSKKRGSGANHWWDCEVYNQAAADMLGVYTLRDDVTEEGVQTYQAARQTTTPTRSRLAERKRVRGNLAERRKTWSRKERRR